MKETDKKRVSGKKRKRGKLFDVLVHVVAVAALLGFLAFFIHLVVRRTTRERGIRAGTGLIISYNIDNPKIVNGWAYEKGLLDTLDYESVTVPNSAIVRRGKNEGSITIFLEKEFGFVGHPPYQMHIRDARNYMGCAYKAEGKSVKIATYGEWENIEGAASIRMLFVIPKKLTLKKEEGLSGWNSIGHTDDSEWFMSMIDINEFQKCYWYGPISPAEGWTRIDTVPDAELTARGWW